MCISELISVDASFLRAVLPGDILKFFQMGSSTLLIKGEPGTGKTTLALTLASLLPSRRVFYLTTRVSGEDLLTQFPWVKERTDTVSVIDLRLGTPEIFLEKFMEGLRTEASLVILDSWDAFAEPLDHAERLKTEGAMVSLTSSRTSSSRVIFVSESEATTKLDYMVDGVVTLKCGDLGGRALRRMEIKKLRGAEVSQRIQLFTLKGGKANVFSPYGEPDYSRASAFQPVKDEDSQVSLGAPVLDSAFGRLRRGSVFVIEYQSCVPYSALRLLATPPQVNFINLGRAAVTLPLFGSEVHIFEKTFRAMLSGISAQEKHLVLLKNGLSQEESLDDREKMLSIFEEKTEEIRKNSADGLVMNVVSVTRFERMFLSETRHLMRVLGRIIDRAQNKGDILLFYLPSESETRDMLRSVATKHVRLDVVAGIVLVWGEKPFTPLYAVEPDRSNPFLPSLTPIL